MEITIHTVILATTVIVSLNAMNNASLKDRMMYVPYLCKRDHQYYRILSHLLIHADFTHLLFNMMSFYYLGKGLEFQFIERFGMLQGELYFLSLYLLGGLFATLIPYSRNQDNPGYRSLGASGAVSAVIFAFVLWNPNVQLLVMFIPMKAWIFGFVYLAYEFYADKKGNTGIAGLAH